MNKRNQLYLLAVLFISAIGVTTFAADTSAVYKNVDKGFSLRLPNTWEVKEGVGGMDLIASSPMQEKSGGQFRPTVSVVCEILQQKQPINEYAQKRITKFRDSMKDLQFLRTGHQIISHTNARWWIISYSEKTVAFKGFLFIVIKGNKAFTITCIAALNQYPAYKDTLGDIASSLVVD